MINFFAFSENDIFLPQIVFTVRYDRYSVLVPAFKPVAVYTTSASFFYAKLFSLYLQVFFRAFLKLKIPTFLLYTTVLTLVVIKLMISILE